MYLVDAKANKDVTSIASVSGGSLTNAFVGQTVDFRNTNSAEFETYVAGPLATQIAKRGTLFAPFLTKVFLLVLVVGAVLVFAPFFTVAGTLSLRLLFFLILLSVWGWLFGKRGAVCARAFKKTLFSPSAQPTPLCRLSRKDFDHVICATELRSAEQVYFSGDFVYSYWLGHGRPADLMLARAVQASACFPGGFPPAQLPTKRHQFTDAPTHAGGPPSPPKKLMMSDGGVYDNMGDQWARGFEERVERWPELGHGRLAPDRSVVINASARVPWTPFRQLWLPLIGEVAALLRVNEVMYINTTNVRRQEIVRSYDPNNPNQAGSLPSVLVQIAQSPFVVAETFAGRSGPAANRARAVLEQLGQTKETWATIVRENAAVKTTLKRLEPGLSASLIYQGYAVTMCNLHVIFGEEFPLRPLEFERFLKLV
jgi:hypothetical protein